MGIDLVNNNTSGNLIAFVQKGNQQFYCLAEVEYWIGEWWEGYIDLDKGSLEELYFEFIHQFKLDYSDLKEAYDNLVALGDTFKLDGNKPSLFIDFDKQLFFSDFYDQALENRLPKGWKGQFGGAKESIPNNFNYWNTTAL